MSEHLTFRSAQKAGQVQSVARALSILNMLGSPQSTSGLGLSEVAQNLGVSKSTAHALLQTLKQYGYVTRVEPGPRFLLGMSLMRLGELVHQRMPLTDAAQPFLHSLAQRTGCTARLIVPDHGLPLFVSRVEGVGNIQFKAEIGKHERPHTTGVGKIILASKREDEVLTILDEHGMEATTPNTITDPMEFLKELARVRRLGYAIDNEEDSAGIVCIASGVTDSSGHCIGALSVSNLAVKMPEERVDLMAEVVKDHAERLSASLA